MFSKRAFERFWWISYQFCVLALRSLLMWKIFSTWTFRRQKFRPAHKQRMKTLRKINFRLSNCSWRGAWMILPPSVDDKLSPLSMISISVNNKRIFAIEESLIKIELLSFLLIQILRVSIKKWKLFFAFSQSILDVKSSLKRFPYQRSTKRNRKDSVSFVKKL